LDDKIDGKKSFVQNAPKIKDFLTKQEIDDFEKIVDLLKTNNIQVNIDPTLVRGLDYYTNLVFEINSTDERLIAQPTIIGGGRYAKLVSELGGEDCSCLGFALGIERLLLVCEYENITLIDENNIDVVIACLTNEAITKTFELMKLLRTNKIKTVCKFDLDKLSKILTYANNIKSKFIIIIGQQEINSNSFVVKNLDLNQQKTLSINEIVGFIKG
jgi:histidyl-tRNA synthetase